MKHLLIILFASCFWSTATAQKAFSPKFTYIVELGLPIAASNVAFKDVMQGLVSVGTYQQYSFPFHLNVGLGLKYSYFAIDEFSVPTPVYGGIHTGTAFIKIGYDKFHNDRFATDFGFKIGYAENFISSDLNEKAGVNPFRIQSSYVEPMLGLILTANPRNSYRFNLGYAFQGFSFKPVMLGLESNGDFDESKLENIMQYISVGFGYTLYIGVKQSD